MRYELTTYENFDEVKYLVANPDVNEGVRLHQFKSGKEHFETFGINENRYQKIDLSPDASLAVVHIPKCAGTSLRVEIDATEKSLYRGNKYSFRKSSKISTLSSQLPKFMQSKSEVDAWSKHELSAAKQTFSTVMGHISLKNFYISGFQNFLIIVREPRTRLLSEAIFLINNKDDNRTLEKLKVKSFSQYFQRYMKKWSDNVINQLVSPDILFDDKYSLMNVSCYWNDEIPRIMMEVFGKKSLNVRQNVVTKGTKYQIDFRMLDLLYELTMLDVKVISRMINAKLLSERSDTELDSEFKSYIKKSFDYSRTLL